MKRATVYLPAEAVDQADELARLSGRTRAEVLRDCLTWGLAREHAWRLRALEVERRRSDRESDRVEAIRRARQRHPERFDRS